MKNYWNPQRRAMLYNDYFGDRWPDSKFMISDRWISATWFIGNNYRSESKRNDKDEPFFGSYPRGYLKRTSCMFPDAVNILHLFSGSLTDEQVHEDLLNNQEAFRVDGDRINNPDAVYEIERVSEIIIPSSYDLIFADPPYSVEDAEHYGKCLVNKQKVLKECCRILKPGGSLLWMDQSPPIYAKRDWNFYGTISIYRSTNNRIRGVMMFEKI
jgi:16S rRNA G966 N2-methylase RsmD